ncbi:unnamed protein product, partial [Ectocarpus sp. 12 AP-2014]
SGANDRPPRRFLGEGQLPQALLRSLPQDHRRQRQLAIDQGSCHRARVSFAPGQPTRASFFVPQRPPPRQLSLSSTLRDGAMVELLLPPWRVPAPAEAEG